MIIEVSATELQSHLFDYLDRVAAGESIVIRRNNREVARLIPAQQADWRDTMHTKPKFLVDPEELVRPIEEIWENYI